MITGPQINVIFDLVDVRVNSVCLCAFMEVFCCVCVFLLKLLVVFCVSVYLYKNN